MIRLEQRLCALMVAAQAGDAAAYRLLLREVGEPLRRFFARRLGAGGTADAEDLVQETLLAVHSRRATYDAARPFTAWLHAIAHYKLVDHFRRSRSRTTVPLDENEPLFSADDAAAAEARLDLDRLLAGVSPRQQQLIRQIKLEGQSVAATAAATGLSESAVKVGVHRGLRALAGRVRGKLSP